MCGMLTLRKSGERGHADHGWLKTHHTFSFADYHDSRWMGFRSLRVLNDDVVLPGMGFGRHPHRDMEILTYILSGQLEHRDSMGNGRILKAGEVQYMAAGTGVEHSEFNPSSTDPVHLLQIWIVPDQRGVEPRYADRSFAGVASGRLLRIASKAGQEGAIAIHQDADLWLAHLEPGQGVTHSLSHGRHAWVHVADGEAFLNGQRLGGGDAAALSDETTVKIEATQDSRILLFDLA